MLDPTLVDRYTKLTQVGLAAREEPLATAIRGIGFEMARRGLPHSSIHATQLKEVHEHELETRVGIVWSSLRRAREVLGPGAGPDVREDLKAEIIGQVRRIGAELSGSLSGRAQGITLGYMPSLTAAIDRAVAQQEIEIDLYVDSLANDRSSEANVVHHTYTFNGNVGSVQTGANSQATVFQALNSGQRVALSQAVDQVKIAIRQSEEMPDRQRTELLEIAEDCQTQMNSDTPNNTKLFNGFLVLATGIQAVASAQPAYQALRLALMPLGISLP